jgi:anti-anti-sigma factor
MFIDIEKRDGVCILRCRGRFVSGPDLEYMQAKLEDVKAMNCNRVLADFRDVPSIGSMGVGFLVGLFTSVVRKAGGRFVLAGARPLVLHVLELTRLNTVIPLAGDVASGLASLAAESGLTTLAGRHW